MILLCRVLWVSENRSITSDSLWPYGILQNTGVGSVSLLQGIFQTQGSNPGLPHCRWILYQLSHKESPRILEWIAYPFSRGSSWPRNWTRLSYSVGRFFSNWALREASKMLCMSNEGCSYWKRFKLISKLHPRHTPCSPGKLTDMLQNNHRDISNSGVCVLSTQRIQTNHRGFSNYSTCALDAQLCPQVTLGSEVPIKVS